MKSGHLLMALTGIVAAVPGTAQCPPAAVQVVKQYLQLDFDGYGLRGGPEHDRMWRLSLQDVEGTEGPIAVTKAYEVVSAKGDRGACRVKVSFSTFGAIEGNGGPLSFTRKARKDVVSLLVRCAPAPCRIDFKANGWPDPHPSRLATATWLRGLERIRDDAPQIRALRQRIEALR